MPYPGVAGRGIRTPPAPISVADSGEESRARIAGAGRRCASDGRGAPTGAAGAELPAGRPLMATALHDSSGCGGRWLFERGCLNVTCVQCENGKSISPIDSAQPTMTHDADTDSDLARPPDGKHPSALHATPAMLLRSATSRRTAGHVVAHPGSCDSE